MKNIPASLSLAREFRMHCRLAWSGQRPRMAIFVSRYRHCLLDLLHRYQIGEHWSKTVSCSI
jgi:formyltetrahydrofolate deformylase